MTGDRWRSIRNVELWGPETAGCIWELSGCDEGVVGSVSGGTGQVKGQRELFFFGSSAGWQVQAKAIANFCQNKENFYNIFNFNMSLVDLITKRIIPCEFELVCFWFWNVGHIAHCLVFIIKMYNIINVSEIKYFYFYVLSFSMQQTLNIFLKLHFFSQLKAKYIQYNFWFDDSSGLVTRPKI